ncbi:unnamed protein product [Ilex paraguariensis]|uniref:Uncharacterized protein n=1 Tax=Ilex paraguariensis TaxID=185542 RepID=A0ABC8UQ75_9AQUA
MIEYESTKEKRKKEHTGGGWTKQRAEIYPRYCPLCRRHSLLLLVKTTAAAAASSSSSSADSSGGGGVADEVASTTTEILHDFLHLMRVYKDGRIERLEGNDVVPASVDPITGVQSKDVEIAPEIGVGARLYLPPTPTNNTNFLS